MGLSMPEHPIPTDAGASAKPRPGIGAQCLSFAATRAVSLALQTVGIVAVARVLSPAGYGEVSLVLAWVSVVAIPLQLGLPTLIVREVSVARVAGQWGTIRGLIVRVSQVFLIIFGIVTGTGLILAVSGLGGAVGVTWHLWACGLALLPLTILLTLTTSLLRGLGFGTISHVPNLIIRPLASLAGVVFVAWLVSPANNRPLPVMASIIVATMMACCGAVALVTRAWSSLSGHTAVCMSREWIRAAIPMALSSSLYVILINIDIVCLGAMRAEREVGYYRIAVQIASLLVMMLTASNSVVAPRYAELHALGDMAQLRRACATASLTAGCWALFGYLGILLGGSTMIRLVFGADYEPALLPLLVLGLGEVVNAAAGPVGVLLSMGGHERDTLRGVLIAVLVKVAICLALIPTLGPLGAAIAAATSTILWNVLLWLRVRERFGIDVSPHQALVAASRQTALRFGDIQRRNVA
jgi:O-antigen/teichoic acid export membrane protein